MAKPTHTQKPQTGGPAIQAQWANTGPDNFIDGRAYIDGADVVAIQMENRWGIGRLRLLVDPDLRSRFDRQRRLFSEAIVDGDLDTIKRESTRMIAAWRKLDQVALDAGQQPLAPDVWETHNSLTGEVICICRDDVDASHAVRSGRAVVTYSLNEIAHILTQYADHITDIKRAIPGSVVHRLGRERPDAVALVTNTYVPGADDGLDDDVPF